MTTKQREKRRKRQLKEDPMDGAFYAYGSGGLADHTTDPETGLRPNYKVKPQSTAIIDLSTGVAGKTIPPRQVWDEGRWKSDQKESDHWDVWVVSGNMTPGNYLTREYRLPDEQTRYPVPDHPSKWPKYLRDGQGKSYTPPATKGWSSLGSGIGTTKAPPAKKASSGMPTGTRVRCVGCGHFYRIDDLSDHAQAACPSTQDPPVLFVIACECHKDDLQMAATVLEGFPFTLPPKAEAPPAEEDAPEEDAPAEEGAPHETETPASAPIEPEKEGDGNSPGAA